MSLSCVTLQNLQDLPQHRYETCKLRSQHGDFSGPPALARAPPCYPPGAETLARARWHRV